MIRKLIIYGAAYLRHRNNLVEEAWKSFYWKRTYGGASTSENGSSGRRFDQPEREGIVVAQQIQQLVSRQDSVTQIFDKDAGR